MTPTMWLFTLTVLAAFGACGGQSSAAESVDAHAVLARASQLYEQGDYEEAAADLRSIEDAALEAADAVRLAELRPLVEEAAAGAAAARCRFNEAVVALIQDDLVTARGHVEAVLANRYCPIETRISARARLARIVLIERKRPAESGTDQSSASNRGSVPSPKQALVSSSTGSVDVVAEARRLVALGMEAIDQGAFDQAQALFNQAILLVPDAPCELLRIDAGDMDISAYPLTSVEEVVIERRPRVSMNLNLGLGRLVAVDSFQFSGGPVGGVGAPGAVQLPIVQQTQIKTSATAPAGFIGRRQATFVKDYLILTRPRV